MEPPRQIRTVRDVIEYPAVDPYYYPYVCNCYSNGSVGPVKPLFRIKMIFLIHIPPNCFIISPIANHHIIYAWPFILIRYMYNIAQPLILLLSAVKYVVIPYLPYRLYSMISNVYRECFRISRYRE
jgi:hypothetical protein